MRGPVRSSVARDKGLEVFFEVLPAVRMDRVPMRTVLLHFRNVSKEPLRFYLPQSAPFRFGLSTLTFSPENGDLLIEPDPHPHGYVVTEVDFPLLSRGEERTFEQPFTLDPMVPGAGTATRRLPGFESGAVVSVSWQYGNEITRWQGGAVTLDSPTKKLFGGGDIPHIWTGKLEVSAKWTVP